MKNFSIAWAKGSTNLKISNVIDHAKSDVHIASMAHFRDETTRAAGESPLMTSTIGRSLVTLDSTTRVRMNHKFDVCFVMAKEGIAFAKYPSILALESRHGVNFGAAYSTPESAKSFTGYIAESQRQAFLNTVSGPSSYGRFYSFLMDGSMDAGNLEDELVVLLFYCKDDSAQVITSRTLYLSVLIPQSSNADGLLVCLGDALTIMGIDNILDEKSVVNVERKPVLVGGGTDGASVNIARHNGLKGQIQNAIPWFYWCWCYAHRLELACKDGFCSPLFVSIQEMLLRLYYIYEKSSKKSRELADIVQDLREVYEFPKGGDLPIRCHRTRWIAFKRKALQRILDRYGAYIAHLTTLAQDHSLKSADQARLTGYLRNWKKARFLIGSAMYIDAMKPVFYLSLTLQKEDADIVLSIENTLKSMKAIKSLQSKDPREWPFAELLKSRIKVVDGSKEYQGTSFSL